MKARALLGLAFASVLGGCGAAQTLNDAIGAVLAPPNSQMAGEVVSVDTRNQQIRIRTADNQTGWVHYDGNTKVIYQQQEYPVTALEPGDVVSITLQSTGTTNQQLHATEITVTQSAQDRTGTPTTGGTTTSGAQRLEGNVGVIDTTRGTFELRSGGNTVLVALSYNATSAVRTRFSQLRTGDHVRVEGRWVAQGTLQVERFY